VSRSGSIYLSANAGPLDGVDVADVGVPGEGGDIGQGVGDGERERGVNAVTDGQQQFIVLAEDLREVAAIPRVGEVDGAQGHIRSGGRPGTGDLGGFGPVVVAHIVDELRGTVGKDAGDQGWPRVGANRVPVGLAGVIIPDLLAFGDAVRAGVADHRENAAEGPVGGDQPMLHPGEVSRSQTRPFGPSTQELLLLPRIKLKGIIKCGNENSIGYLILFTEIAEAFGH